VLKRLLLPVVAVTALTAVPAEAAKFQYGVSASEVRSTSAILWAKATKAGLVRLVVDRRVIELRARKSNDLTVQKKVGRLKPGKRYRYRFFQGRNRSKRGTFRTAPRATADVNIGFAWSGDADAQRAPGQTQPFWNNFQVYERMAQERNNFNVNLGDTIYSDTEVPPAGQPPALTVAQKWAKYRQNLGLRPLQRLRTGAAIYNHWDDHEFINDFSIAESGQDVYNAGVKAFRNYQPVTYSRANGIYRSFRWGRNLEIFMLDERSFRSAKASAGGTCNNPATGSPDLAPTAPTATRLLFAALVPSLTEPVSPACLATINDPNRTMLGARQFNRFTSAVAKSNAVFKVIMNEVPIQQFYALPYDRWEGYAAERTRLLQALSGKVDNVVFLTTDVHANLVNDARFQTLEPGGAQPSGILDVTTGPVGTATFQTEIDQVTGPGSGAQIDSLFFNGILGMQCSVVDTYSYGQVDVTNDKLTITLKDLNGQPLTDGGNPCGPFEIEAK
jgi:phosphodiesterase/alkaline phosphatase D-like protein